MNNNDILHRFLFENLPVRGMVVTLGQSFQTIMRQHNYPEPIRQLLGEMLVAANLLSASIKFKGRVTIQFRGNKQVKLLLAQCNQDHQFRGLAQWEGEVEYEALLEQLKQGILAIIIDPEVPGGARYEGIVSWQGNSFAQSIEHYFQHSEQLATKLWIFVDKDQAAGLLIQVMPQEAVKLENQTLQERGWEHVTHLTATITKNELLTLDHAVLLQRLYVEEDVRLFSPISVSFGCACSVKRSENALLMIGQEEVQQELNEKQKIVVTCEFCSQEYVFHRADIDKLFNQKPDSSHQVH